MRRLMRDECAAVAMYGMPEISAGASTRNPVRVPLDGTGDAQLGRNAMGDGNRDDSRERLAPITVSSPRILRACPA